MRWQYYLAAVIGAFLGFTAQLVADEVQFPFVVVSSTFPGEFPDLPHPYHWSYSADGRALTTPYKTVDGALSYPDVPEDVRKWVKVPANQKAHWQMLWYQLRFLDWLRDRGEEALRCATIGAVLSAFTLFAVDRFRAKRKTQRTASAS